jgi:hypothetical protein
MEPPSLIVPPAIALGWSATLRRDGFIVTPCKDGYSGAISYEEREYRLILRGNGTQEFSCDLSVVKNRRAASRIERIFLASGAKYNLEEFRSDPVQLLYRCSSGGMGQISSFFRDFDTLIDLHERVSFGGARSTKVEPYLSGWLGSGSQRIAFETGPALDPEKQSICHFIQVRPEFIVRMTKSQKQLMVKVHQTLLNLGVEVVITMRMLQGKG